MAMLPVKTPGEALDKNSSAGMNFKVLKRILPNLDKILATAGQAALYCFNTDTNEWVKRDTEGTFFVVENRSIPHLQIVVLNQKGANYFDDIGRGFRLEQKQSANSGRSFLLYRNTKREVISVFFFDPDECAKILSLLSDLIKDRGLDDSDESVGGQAVQLHKPQEADAHQRRSEKLQTNFITQFFPSLLNGDKIDQRSEATPSKAPVTTGNRAKDANASSASHLRTSQPSSNTTPFMKTLGNKTFGSAGKQTSQPGVPQPPIRTAGLPPVNHTEILEALGNIQSSLLPAGETDNPESHAKALLRTPPAQSTSQGLQGTGSLRKSEMSSSCPAPLGQKILKPDFFQNILAASKEQESNGSTQDRNGQASSLQTPEHIKDNSAVKQPTSEQQRMRNFFLKQKLRVEKEGQVVDISSRPAEATSVPAKQSAHETVRAVMKELAESDVFIETIVQQLAKRRLLPDT